MGHRLLTLPPPHAAPRLTYAARNASPLTWRSVGHFGKLPLHIWVGTTFYGASTQAARLRPHRLCTWKKPLLATETFTIENHALNKHEFGKWVADKRSTRMSPCNVESPAVCFLVSFDQWHFRRALLESACTIFLLSWPRIRSAALCLPKVCSGKGIRAKKQANRFIRVTFATALLPVRPECGEKRAKVISSTASRANATR